MLDSFSDIILENQWHHKSVLIAVSGGVDSMVLLALCKAFQQKHDQFRFEVAHCNYQLRGQESHDDAQLIIDYCTQEHIKYHVKTFDMPQILAAENLNLQDTARTLRYDWFQSLLIAHKLDYIATAHHQEDSVETLLFNLFRGTGIAGLHGILMSKNNIIRPLLYATKPQLIDYATSHNIPWREDKSNQKSNYSRNKIRLEILPFIEQSFPNATQKIFETSQHLLNVEAIYNDYINQKVKQLIEPRGKEFYISVLKLQKTAYLDTTVYELFKSFGFTHKQVPDILQLLDAISGQQVINEQFKIIKNRNFLIVTPVIHLTSEFITIDAPEVEDISFEAGRLIFQKGTILPNFETINNQTIYIATNKLKYPLILRKWKIGDYFYPIGMNMKKKKVSKLLVDLKIPIHKKEEIWILESDQKIIWVVGHRMDERFKLKSDQTEYLQVTFSSNS